MLVVLGSRAALGVVLDAEDRQAFVAQPFHRPVVEVALGDEKVPVRERSGVHLELVVLAGDVHAARLQVLDRGVGAVVAEWKSGCARAGGAAKDLVSQANPEDRNASDGQAGQLDWSVQDCRIAWPIGQDHAVRSGGFDVPPARGVWQDDDATSSFAKRAKNVGLDPIVDDGDRQSHAVRVPSRPQLGRQPLKPLHFLRSGGFRHQVLLGQRRHRARPCRELGEARPARCFRLMGQDCAQRSMSAQVTRERARVDLGDPRHLPSFQVFIERGLAGVMAREGARPADDERTDPGPRRLCVGVADPIVALQGIRHADHLTRVRRVGEHFLVAGHRRVEDDLTLAGHVRAQGGADE